MSAQSKPARPIVLVLGGGGRVLENIGNDNCFTEHIFGVRPMVLQLSSDVVGWWWVDPTTNESLHEIFEKFPSFGRNKILRWVETDAFVKYVRRELGRWMTYKLTGTSEGANLFTRDAWREAVVMTVISNAFEPVNSSYTQRVFGHYSTGQPYFPNSSNFMFDHHDHITPLWNTWDEKNERRQHLELVEPEAAEVV